MDILFNFNVPLAKTPQKDEGELHVDNFLIKLLLFSDSFRLICKDSFHDFFTVDEIIVSIRVIDSFATVLLLLRTKEVGLDG